MRAVALALALSLWAGGANAQILTENAGVTPPTIPTLRELLTFEDWENSRSLRLDQQLIVGVTPKIELKLTLPTVLHQRVRFAGLRGDESRALAGLGDARLDLKLSLWQDDGVLESTRWALIAGVRAPTGEDDREDDGVRLPRRLQLGSGAWGVRGGTAFTVIRNRHRLSLDLEYSHHTRHEGIRLGDSVGLDVAYWYRLTPATFDPEDERTEVRAVFELLSRYRFDSLDAAGGLGDRGIEVWAAPGLQIYPSRSVLFELSLQVPLIRTIDDALGRPRWKGLLAIKILF